MKILMRIIKIIATVAVIILLIAGIKCRISEPISGTFDHVIEPYSELQLGASIRHLTIDAASGNVITVQENGQLTEIESISGNELSSQLVDAVPVSLATMRGKGRGKYAILQENGMVRLIASTKNRMETTDIYAVGIPFVNSGTFSPNCSRLAAFTRRYPSDIIIFDIQRKAVISIIKNANCKSGNFITDSQLVAASLDKGLIAYNISSNTSKCLASTFDAGFISVVSDQDGRWLVASPDTQSIYLISDSINSRVYFNTLRLTSVSDNNTLAIATLSNNHVFTISSVAADLSLVPRFSAILANPTCFAISFKYKICAVANSSGTLRLYRLP